MTVPFWDRYDEGNEGPDYSEEPWDLLVLQGMKVPGISKVRCVPKMKLDVQKPNGLDGSQVIARGHLPADVQITITIWTRAQWEIMQGILDAIWRKPGKDSRRSRTDASATVSKEGAISASHPALALYGVSSIILEQPESPEEGANGERVIKMKALQFTPKTARKATRKIEAAPSDLHTKFQPGQPAKNGVPAKPSTTDGGPNGPPQAIDPTAR